MEKVITGKELRAILRAKYRLIPIPPVDGSYFLPSKDFVNAQLVNSTVRETDFMPETHDCDDYAIILLGKVRLRQYRERWKFPMAFGISSGVLADGRAHVVNIAVLDTKEVLFLDATYNNTTNFVPNFIWV